MSIGRWIMRGRVFQGRAFRPWALAGEAEAAVVTKRLTLVGTSMQRLVTVGTSQERLTIEGASR